MYKDVQYRIIYHKVRKKLICSKMNYSFSIKWKIAQSLKIMFLKKKKLYDVAKTLFHNIR